MQNKTILVIETDRGLRRAMVQVLSAAGYDVIAGESFGAGLQMVDRLGVDVMISDVRLSTPSRQRSSRAAQRTPRPPKMLFVTHAPLPGGASPNPAGDVITMPLDGTALVDKVRALLAA
jgi:DNA-binding NtrC family response regulator